ncbi:MAG: SAP domain-containing protein [Geobacteraceae bacterium]|nr:SAP domain-containing protein [Geobacteraceae bacterium]NTW81184.1 SAP domain-containing protein [Geobacteraceae bacterium]
MTLKEVKNYAKVRGVKPEGTKSNIIRAIQAAEGYLACFGTRPVAECPEESCLWRQDCLHHA